MKKLLCLFSLLLLIFSVELYGAEKTIVVAQGSKPKSLDPHRYNEIPGLSITRQIFNTLLAKDSQGNIVPELAESYKYNSPKELIIALKEGIKFHNGDTLTADDVIFSLERMLEQPGSKVMLADIDKIEKVDEKTVKLLLKNSSTPLLFGLAHPLTAILNKRDTLEKNGNISDAPVGTGPFKITDFGNGEKIELAAFDDYFKGKAKLDKLVYRAIPEASSRVIALETGEVDIAYGIVPTDSELVESNDNLTLISQMSTSTEYLTLNTTKEPFNNKDFRVALNYAIDKESIVDAVHTGKAKVAHSFVNPNVFGFSDEIIKYEYNPAKAKELIEKSGVINKNFTLYINENQVRQQTAQILQANFKEVGIDVKIETLEWGAYVQKTGEGLHQTYLGGWVSGTSDADIVLFPLLHSSSHGSVGNRAFYTNKEYDKLVEQGREEIDPEKRKEYYKKAQEIAMEESPLVPILYQNENIGVNKKVKGFEFDPTLMHSLYNLDKE